jgi:hypothetical protein
MLNVERRYMIKEWYRMGWSVSDIARHSGHDRKTKGKVIADALLPAPVPKTPMAYREGRYGAFWFCPTRHENGIWCSCTMDPNGAVRPWEMAE